jgi:parvulin-like peptidyl-prolyl isomerase
VRLNARLTEAELTNVGRQILLTRLTSEELARQAAQQFADQVLAAAQAGTALEQAVTDRLTQVIDAAALPRQHRDALREAALASEAKPRVEISSSFSPSGNPLPGATGGSPAQQLFALQNADDLHPTPVTTHDGLAVLQLKEKTPATREDFETRKNDIIRELRLRKQSDAVVSYVKRLRDAMQAQIQIDARFLDETQSPAEDG